MHTASTQATTSLRIGGVPEHFNLPWHLGMEAGAFANAGIDLSWSDCPGGTGEMISQLEAGELDLIVTLTEGSVAGIARGVPMRILQWYVTSPLHWGVHVRSDEPAASLNELSGRRVAVSREGSGSHLMAAVLAEQQQWPLDTLAFINVGHLQGAVEAFRCAQADIFLWERFTTQPLVDQGLMRRLAVCPTPWPAFVLCAHRDVYEQHGAALARLQKTINGLCAHEPKQVGFAQQVSERYQLERSEVRDWLAITRWAQTGEIDARQLDSVIDHLDRLSLLRGPVAGSDCLAVT